MIACPDLKNSFKEISLMQESFPKKNYQNLFGHFVHGFNLKSYSFDKYKSKKINSSIQVEVIGKYKNENLKKLNYQNFVHILQNLAEFCKNLRLERCKRVLIL